MKGLLLLFTQGDQCTLLAGASGKHVEKFSHFKEFLSGNRKALRALAVALIVNNFPKTRKYPEFRL